MGAARHNGPMVLDTIVRAGRLVDGSGAKPRTADVAIVDGRIAGIGRIRDRARRTLDADGALVVPGAIALLPPRAVAESDPDASRHLAPGVTTVVEVLAGDTASTAQMPAYLHHLGARRFLVDRAMLVDHGALRSEVMGLSKVRDRLEPSSGDLERMGDLLAEALAAGIRGLRSTLAAGAGAERRAVIAAAFRRRLLDTGERPWLSILLEPDRTGFEAALWRQQARGLLDQGASAAVVASDHLIDDPDIFTALCPVDGDATRLRAELGGGNGLVGPTLNPLALVAIGGPTGEQTEIEAFVRRFHATADAFGLDDRGVLAPGFRADLNVLDGDQLTSDLTQGFVSTLVGGVEIAAFDELTGEYPGRIC